jgi:O-antigen/teichoic acid export membrane protein
VAATAAAPVSEPGAVALAHDDETAAAAGTPVPDRDREARRILRNTAYRASADVASKVISLVFFVGMARFLGTTGFGTFVFALSFGIVVTTLAEFGQDQILTREVARDHGKLDEYFANTVALKSALATPALLLALGVLALAGVSRETLGASALMAFAVLVELLMMTCYAVYQAFERLVFFPVVVVTQRVFTTAVGFTAMAFGASVIGVASVYLAGAVLALGLSVVLMVRRVARARVEIDTSSWWPLMRAAAPIGIATVFGLVLARGDTLLLAVFEPSSVVGTYGAAYRLYEATFFVGWAVSAAVFPVLSRLSPTTTPSVRAMTSSSLKLVIAASVPAAVTFVILGRPLLDLLYGAAFVDGAEPLAMLGPAVVLHALALVLSTMLVSQNRARVITLAYGGTATLHLLAGLALISMLSMRGAALTTMLSELVLVAALIVAARGAAPGIDWRRASVGPALAGGVAAAVMIALRSSFPAALLVSLTAYAVVLVAFETRVYPADARVVLRFLGRRHDAAPRPS